jgi:hypothetical protein
MSVANPAARRGDAMETSRSREGDANRPIQIFDEYEEPAALPLNRNWIDHDNDTVSDEIDKEPTRKQAYARANQDAIPFIRGKPHVTLDVNTGIVTKTFRTDVEYYDAKRFFDDEWDNEYIVPLVSIDPEEVQTEFLTGYVTLKAFSDAHRGLRYHELLDRVREKMYDGFASLRNWYDDLANPHNIMVKVDNEGESPWWAYETIHIKFIEGGPFHGHWLTKGMKVNLWHNRASGISPRLRIDTTQDPNKAISPWSTGFYSVE